MTKTTAELIKDIRLNSKLTQKQFAKRFFITEKTVSNYETGARTPDLDFIFRVCNEFNLSLDYFMNKQRKESNPLDLIISSNVGKFAIFDKAQNIYLTHHIYDGILLSNCGNHIVYKTQQFIDNKKRESRNVKITYSAIVDNLGNVKEFADLEFGFNGSFVSGVSPAYSKASAKVYLVNNKGELLSRGFSRIQPVDVEANFGLYYGLAWEKKESEDKRLSERKLIYKTGETVELNFDDINVPVLDLRIAKLKNLDIVVDAIKKFGANILQFVPDELFQNGENYPRILTAVHEHALNDCYASQLMYASNILLRKADLFIPVKEKVFGKMVQENFMTQNFAFPFKFGQINSIEENLIKSQIQKLYKKLF